MKEYDWDCMIMHDVDRLPFTSKIDYNCLKTSQVFHYLPRLGGFGGVMQINPKTFTHINGWSNLFYGWGGEDQEMARRVEYAGRIAKARISSLMKEEKVNDTSYWEMNPFKILMPDEEDGRNMVGWHHIHFDRKKGGETGNIMNPDRKTLLKSLFGRWKNDGLNTLDYKAGLEPAPAGFLPAENRRFLTSI